MRSAGLKLNHLTGKLTHRPTNFYQCLVRGGCVGEDTPSECFTGFPLGTLKKEKRPLDIQSAISCLAPAGAKISSRFLKRKTTEMSNYHDHSDALYKYTV